MLKEIVKKMAIRAWGLLVNDNETWDEIVAEKNTIKQIRRNYLYPLILTLVLFSFIFNSLHAEERSLEFGVLGSIKALIVSFGGYFIASQLCFNYLKKYQPTLASRPKCETIVAYSYTVFLLVEIFTTVFSSLFFLQILNVFVAYVLWNGCRAIWQLKEDDRFNIVLFFTLIISLCPVIIKILIGLVIPYNI